MPAYHITLHKVAQDPIPTGPLHEMLTLMLMQYIHSVKSSLRKPR